MMQANLPVTKASFRDCAISDRKLFKISKCIMPISIGQKVHEGEKFSATLKLINASFQSCTILVDDSIQRHTMKIEHEENEDELRRATIDHGNLWLRKSEPLFKILSIPFDIMRWDDWLANSHYDKAYAVISDLYVNDSSFRDALHSNIEDFLSRYVNRPENPKIDYEKSFSFCVDYLKEECAVMCLWAEKKYQFEVYPTGRNKAMQATYEKLIKPRNPDLLKSVALRFKKYPGKISQTKTENELVV